MSTNNHYIDVANVQVSIGKLRILDDISFRLYSGELCALIGPSGAGKSTLMKVLLGLTQATTGKVELGQKNADTAGTVGYVPQDDALHQSLTVRQALTFAVELWLHHLPAAERTDRLQLVTQQVGLADRMDVRISSLSGGQRKRVAVAMELLNQPDLLILDEPTSGLDPGLEAKTMELFSNVAKGGRIVMVATHAMQSLSRCDVLAVLVRGRLAYIGTPSNALQWFQVERYSGIFDVLPERTPMEWSQAFRSSQLSRTFAARTPGVSLKPDAPTSEKKVVPPSKQDDLRAKLEELKRARGKQ